MGRYICVLSMGLLLYSGLLFCMDWLEQNPYTEWTENEVLQVLNQSPWVSARPAGIRVEEFRDRAGDPTSNYSQISMPIYYQVRLLTAKPVREAFLRWIALWGIPQSTVNIKNLSTKASSAEKNAALAEYLASHPNDGAMAGDDKNIIIGITLKIGRYGSLTWTEESSALELSNVAVSQLKTQTVLSTNTGKNVRLVKYEPPGRDWFGARYYFPRYLPNGVPFLAGNDGKLLFETRINGRSLKVKFNLKKMRYKGILEF